MNQTINTALLAILNSLWIVTAVTAAVALAMKASPRVNAATRYAVWWSVLGMVVALPLAMVGRAPWFSASEPVTPRVSAATPAHYASVSEAPVVESPQASSSPAEPSARFLPIELHTGTWSAWILALWTVVFLFHVARIGWSYRYLRGVARRAHSPDRARQSDFDRWTRVCDIRRPVRLLLSDEVGSPMAIGFFNPAVILPETLLSQLHPEDLDHVLLHELAHIARYDDWTKLAAHLASATLGLHPVAAWILRRIEREREIACDDWVVAGTGTARPYAVSLARLLELCVARRRDLLAAGLGRSSQLRERIERLLDRARQAGNETPRMSRGRVALCAAILVMVLAVGARSPHWIAFAQHPAVPVPAPAPTAGAAPSAAPALPAASPAHAPTEAPDVPALHARVQQYYSYMQQGRYGEAASFTTKATRNNFLNTHRNQFLSVKIDSVQLWGVKTADGPYRAQVTAQLETSPFGAVATVFSPETTTWAQVGKTWYLEAPAPHVPTFEELTAGGKPNKPEAPVDVKFATTESDMGKLKHGETGVAIFPFKNTTDHPVTIEVSTYCECLVVKNLKKRYQPGETGELRLDFNSSQYLDDYAQTIFVKTLPGGATTSVHVKGFVIRPQAEIPSK
jgi:beta-lactamase regulating signal transducer with metallopeptidase domain